MTAYCYVRRWDVTTMFMHSVIHAHQDFLRLLAVVNAAIMNMDVQISTAVGLCIPQHVCIVYSVHILATLVISCLYFLEFQKTSKEATKN